MAGKETFEFGEERNVDAINEKAFKSRYMDPKLKVNQNLLSFYRCRKEGPMWN